MHECRSRLEQATPRRAVNGLNVEIATPLARCMNKPPVNVNGIAADAFRWLGSGGSELAFGVCDVKDCPLNQAKAAMNNTRYFGWNYPAGAESDPRAPWNQVEQMAMSDVEELVAAVRAILEDASPCSTAGNSLVDNELLGKAREICERLERGN